MDIFSVYRTGACGVVRLWLYRISSGAERYTQREYDAQKNTRGQQITRADKAAVVVRKGKGGKETREREKGGEKRDREGATTFGV